MAMKLFFMRRKLEKQTSAQGIKAFSDNSFYLFFLSIFIMPMFLQTALANELELVSFSKVEQGLEIKFNFSESAHMPTRFSTEVPARIILDFSETQNKLPWRAPLPVNIGVTSNIQVVENNDTTRVVVNLSELVQFDARVEDNAILLVIEDHTLDDDSVSSDFSESVQNEVRDEAELKDIQISALPGDRVQVTFLMSGDIVEPNSFTVDEPARIALDFPNTQNSLSWRSRRVGIGLVKSVAAIEAGGRTRVVFNLVRQMPYDTQVEGNKVVLTLGTGIVDSQSVAVSTSASAGVEYGVEQIDFRRGDAGEGRVVVTFADPSVLADIREEGGRIIADFINTSLPQELEQRLDVIDFATPVQTIDTFTDGNNVRMVIAAQGRYEHLAYQSDKTLTIDIKAITKEKAVVKKEEYTGEKLSLNFQDIEVRAVLQLLADFTALNVVVSDSVQGNITLRLKNVPWDQALDIILKSKGLAMRQSGNVLLVAPGEEIASREKLELESRKQISELIPLRSELIQINYAKAASIANLLKSDNSSLLSGRGNVTVDERTNTLLVRDTSDRLDEIRKLIAKLDIPIRQVLIEARIVIANDNFAKDLGVKFGLQSSKTSGDSTIMTSGGVGGLSANLGAPGSLQDDLSINLPAGAARPASLALGMLNSDVLLGLELSALQTEGRGEVVSNPRVITSNQKEALIEQGTEIPYSQAASSGATTVAFKKATLSLKVTPQITPDDRVILDLKVTKDSVGAVFNNVPSIDTKEVNTQVLVDNGETVVLGGIYEQVKQETKSKVPFLGDLPLVGGLCRSTKDANNKKELLIFVTPKILKESLKL